jgi:hypothetical protein
VSAPSVSVSLISQKDILPAVSDFADVASYSASYQLRIQLNIHLSIHFNIHLNMHLRMFSLRMLSLCMSLNIQIDLRKFCIHQANQLRFRMLRLTR